MRPRVAPAPSQLSAVAKVSVYALPAPAAPRRCHTLVPDMAAELQLEWISALPSSWTYGVTRDGRVFFINEEAKSTTWLHPVSGEAVSTGHRKTPGKEKKKRHSAVKFLLTAAAGWLARPQSCVVMLPPQNPDSTHSDGVNERGELCHPCSLS
ncbi:hypothetical protein CHARACLAT_013909 [Characodon lateralis]|uniref:WW domain-containing protein n=1 Tax=Characodon lateralis TaxID=208331 RepID=A0ABU7E2G9_9TELE|nr:hypothetical protein [Characodon lateralis]